MALLQEVKRARLSGYAAARPSAQYHDKAKEGTNQWSVKVDIALSCATQNELNPKATEYFQANIVLFCPVKAANAGGVGPPLWR